ncbi:hypothetical protein NMY22_g1668 [Coprinellus aureogranulatus]|nr:hypothetical protein NMY22_g1668 [Coprinellus aureogranulatus]
MGPLQSLNPLPRPSVTLKEDAGRQVLRRLKTSLSLIGSLLGVLHPEFYNQQMEVYEQMNDHPERHTAEPELTQSLLDDWYTPFDGFALVANHEGESERHSNGGLFCMDILGAFGSYRGGRLEVPLLGRRFVYNPGTAFALPGSLFEHGASRVDGERICLTSFMKPAVGRGILGDRWQDILPPTADFLSTAFFFKLPEVESNDIWN